jgi:hypothetical protein
VCNIVNGINNDMILLNHHVDHCCHEIYNANKDIASLLEKFYKLEERVMTLEAVNIEKEGCIDTLESLVDSMSDQLCCCADRDPHISSGLGSKEDPFKLKYTSDKGSDSSY